MLESVKTPGQYLHSSHSVFGDVHPCSSCHEVNLAFQPAVFTIYPHISLKDHKPEFLHGGSVVQLFHKVHQDHRLLGASKRISILSSDIPLLFLSSPLQERDAYIAAEGNYASELVENVHLRIREPDATRPNRLFPPTSAVSVS